MPLTVLMSMPITPGLTHEIIDEVLRHDLPHTASYPGNEVTEVIRAEENSDILVLLTKWSTCEAYEAYSAWRRTPEGATRMAEIVSGPPTFQRFSSYMTFTS